MKNAMFHNEQFSYRNNMGLFKVLIGLQLLLLKAMLLIVQIAGARQ